jgi:uncharacterized membrane protein YeaQ/YmgE (transglycosylase-associated protein family)
MGILMFIMYLLIASACAWIAAALVPGTVPGGFLASVIVGVLGAWVGTSLMGAVGPDLAGVPLLPAILGSALLIFLFSLVAGRFWVRRGYRRDLP